MGYGVCAVTRKFPGGAGRLITDNWNELVSEVVPSLTVIVIKATPVRPDAGITVTFRLVPLPPKTMFELGTRDGLLELADNVRLEAAVSASPIVKGMEEADVSTATV